MIKEAIQKLLNGESLSPTEAAGAMEEIMDGTATPAQIGGFLVALRAKGETVEELAAFAKVMRGLSERIHPQVQGRLVDTCGTGGDQVKTFNVSTVAALVVAGAGIPVAKHGGRSVTGICGSADLLQALGVNVEATPKTVETSIQDAGIGFMFAPVFHPAMKNAAGPRKEIGVRTVFNMLGPLTNPANAPCQLIGVYDQSVGERMAHTLRLLGSERVMVVHGLDGVDEISVTDKTTVTELTEGAVKTYQVDSSDFGVSKAKIADLMGSTPQENAATTLRLLHSAKANSDPKTNMLLANAAAALVVAGKVGSFKEGVEVARSSIQSGAAYKKLKELVKHSGGDLSKIEGFESKHQ
ncbi:MAG: anthranilate phosphoribosyltransferase [Thaumarchaeota archaeon]|nr:anthranilate phosphoribosyltransferase [Nitrososphaerota archaeon]